MGCADGRIRVYDVITGELNGILGPRPGEVKSLHFSSNGYWLAETGTIDTSVRIWDLRKEATIAHELNGSSASGKVRWDHSGQFLALGGDKGVDVWAYRKKDKVFEKIGQEPFERNGVQCMDWGLDGRIIVCGGLSDGTICVIGVEQASGD